MINAEKQAGEMFMAAVNIIVKQLNDTQSRNHTAYEARFAQLERQITDLDVESRDMQKAWHELARQIKGGEGK